MPNATRVVYGHVIVGDQKTSLEADPGEIHFQVESDPGASLDSALTAHDHTVKSKNQLKVVSREADRKVIETALGLSDPLSADAVKALARFVLTGD